MFYCSDLTRMDNFKDIRLIAGENGLYNAISRPFICYGEGFEEWISGDELVFINGKGIDTGEKSLNTILKKCIDKKASGLLIFIRDGYIKEIPESLKKLADDSDFPLFEVKSSIDTLEFEKEILSYIVESDIRINREKEIIEHFMMYSGNSSKNMQRSAEQCGLSLYEKYFILILKADSGNYGIARLKEQKESRIRKLMKAHGFRYAMREKEAETIIIIGIENKEEYENSKELIKKIYLSSKEIDILKDNITICISDICEEIGDVRKEYDKILDIYKAYKRSSREDFIIDYRETGFYRILLEVKNKRKLYEYSRSVIGSIMDHDSKKSGNMLLTLEAYLKNDCSLVKTSKELFIHRNTLIYRLNRIREVMNNDLESAVVKNECMNAIAILRYLEIL